MLLLTSLRLVDSHFISLSLVVSPHLNNKYYRKISIRWNKKNFELFILLDFDMNIEYWTIFSRLFFYSRFRDAADVWWLWEKFQPRFFSRMFFEASFLWLVEKKFQIKQIKNFEFWSCFDFYNLISLFKSTTSFAYNIFSIILIPSCWEYCKQNHSKWKEVKNLYFYCFLLRNKPKYF